MADGEWTTVLHNSSFAATVNTPLKRPARLFKATICQQPQTPLKTPSSFSSSICNFSSQIGCEGENDFIYRKGVAPDAVYEAWEHDAVRKPSLFRTYDYRDAMASQFVIGRNFHIKGPVAGKHSSLVFAQTTRIQLMHL